jgi:hypothetical protein
VQSRVQTLQKCRFDSNWLDYRGLRVFSSFSSSPLIRHKCYYIIWRFNGQPWRGAVSPSCSCPLWCWFIPVSLISLHIFWWGRSRMSCPDAKDAYCR